MNNKSAWGGARRLRNACAAASLSVSAVVSGSGSIEDARSLMSQVYQQDHSHDVSIRASFEVFPASGPVQRKKFNYRRIGPAGNRKELVAFSEPEEIRGVMLLSIMREGQPDRQYIYVPATRRARSVVAQQRSAPFAGTDFTFEDIEERSIDAFSYKLLGDREIIDAHKTYKIEATAVSAAASQYKTINYWVAQDVPVVLQAELYDQQGVLTRVLHASGLRRISAVWGARRTEMRTVATGSRTVLTIDDAKFDTGLSEDSFTPEALEATRNAPP